jgi:hypothetical protein
VVEMKMIVDIPNEVLARLVELRKDKSFENSVKEYELRRETLYRVYREVDKAIDEAIVKSGNVHSKKHKSKCSRMSMNTEK